MTSFSAATDPASPDAPTRPVPIIVMGTQGVGKSTIGELLGEALGVPFIDGDRLHPAKNVQKMASGIPLTDADRDPWLHAVGATLAEHQKNGGAVVACSALKRSYRDLLRQNVPGAYIVELWGPPALVQARVQARSHEFMPPTLLQSQYATLEPLADDERGIRVNVERTPAEIVDVVLADYRSATKAR